MILWLEGRAAASIIVTLIAVSSTTRIVSPCAAYKGCGGMTGVAIQGGCKVGGIGLGILTNRCNAIMAGLAIVNDACVIKHRFGKSTGVMTDATILIGYNMSVCFACGETSIMTRDAVIHDSSMIKSCRYKARGLVAVTTITVGWHMVRWRGFAAGGYAIVARDTVINDAQVIKFGTGKGSGVMTH